MKVFQSTRAARTYPPGLVHLKLVRDTMAGERDYSENFSEGPHDGV